MLPRLGYLTAIKGNLCVGSLIDIDIQFLRIKSHQGVEVDLIM